jgi:hypothetical protein
LKDFARAGLREFQPFKRAYRIVLLDIVQSQEEHRYRVLRPLKAAAPQTSNQVKEVS